jgi:hypothetical protein
LKQNEDHENNDDAGRREGMNQRGDQGPQAFQRAGIGLTYFHRNRRHWPGDAGSEDGTWRTRRWRVLWLIKLLAEILQHVGGALQRAPAGSRVSEGLDLFANGRLVAGEVSRELRQLRGKKAAHRENQPEGEYDHADDGQSAGDTDPLQ